MTHSDHDRRFAGEVDRLRSEQRVERLEVPVVVQEALKGMDIDSVLDVGTGSGIFAEAFAQAGMTIKGVDIREDMLEAAQKYVPQGEFKLGHMEKIPFPDQCVDLVMMGLVLHEADDLQTALNEVYRLARKRVIVLEWVYAEQDFGPPLHHRLEADKIIASAKTAGFTSAEQLPQKHLILYRLDK